jgi:hypothetical protein
VGTSNGTDSKVACTLSTGTGFGSTITSGVIDWGYDSGRAWADVQGGHLANFCRVTGTANGTDAKLACNAPTGTGFGPTTLSANLDWGYDSGRGWADADGDGKADYCRRVGVTNGVDSKVSCTLSTGSGFGTTITSGMLDWGYTSGRGWVDANGDGKSDYCRVGGTADFTDAKVACTLSTGSGFGTTIVSANLDWGYISGRAWADVNGDGKADYCRRTGVDNQSDSRVSCTPSTGTGFGPTIDSPVIDWGYDD